MHQQVRGMPESLEQTIVAGDVESIEDSTLMLGPELPTDLTPRFILLSVRVIFLPFPGSSPSWMGMAELFQRYSLVTGDFAGAEWVRPLTIRKHLPVD